MPAPSFLAKDRHGGFLFKIKIPTELLTVFNGKRVLVKSLQTYHRPTALKLARRMAVNAQEVFDQIKMSEKNLSHQMAFAKARLSVKRAQLDDIESGRVAVLNGEVRFTEVSQLAQQLEELEDSTLEIIAGQHSLLQEEVGQYTKKVSDLAYQLDHISKVKLQRKAEEIEGLLPNS